VIAIVLKMLYITVGELIYFKFKVWPGKDFPILTQFGITPVLAYSKIILTASAPIAASAYFVDAPI